MLVKLLQNVPVTSANINRGKNNMNPDPSSLERIHKRVYLGSFSMNNTRDNKYKLPIFLNEMSKKSDRMGLLDWDILISNDEYDEETQDVTPAYVCAVGWRLESVEEYITRLRIKILSMSESKKNWEKRRTYFEGGGVENECDKIQNIINFLSETKTS